MAVKWVGLKVLQTVDSTDRLKADLWVAQRADLWVGTMVA